MSDENQTGNQDENPEPETYVEELAIEVEAGKTLVLDIHAIPAGAPGEQSPEEESPQEEGTVNVEIKIHDWANLSQPAESGGYIVYLSREGNTIPVNIGNNGIGTADIMPGTYSLSFNSDGSRSQPVFVINQSVGHDGTNDQFDVQVLKRRLYDLGFNWVNLNNPEMDDDTIETIKLFQAIVNGHTSYKNQERPNVDGKISVGLLTNKWLRASNAPKWQRMPEGSANGSEGFYNWEVCEQANENYDWGTDWMAGTIENAGRYYNDNYIENPDSEHPNAAKLTINDVSVPRGGVACPHGTHQTGLSCDIRVPNDEGGAGTTCNSSDYDEMAMGAMLHALLDHNNSLVKKRQDDTNIRSIIFNDQSFIDEELCREYGGHHNHAHFDIYHPELVENDIEIVLDAPQVAISDDDNAVEIRIAVNSSPGQDIPPIRRITHRKVNNVWTLVTDSEITDMYGGFDLRRGDRDSKVEGCNGNEQIYKEAKYEGENKPEYASAQHVKHLQEDLIRLGFLIVGAADGDFGRKTFWAVREFQAYAKMTHVAREDTASNAPNYTDRLSRVENPEAVRCDGPVSGVVNETTRAAVRHWLLNNWRCPVVVQARTVQDGNPGELYENGENIWLHDEIDSTAPRMYARDFSNYYTFPSNNPADQLIVLGYHQPFSGRSGPCSNPPNHTWHESEIKPSNLVGINENELSDNERSTFKVVRAVSEVECMGYFDSINAYDNAFISLGPCHWTLGIITNGAVSEGELCGFLSYLRQFDEDAFQKAIEFFGVRINKEWNDNGQEPFTEDLRKYAAWVMLQQENGEFAVMERSENYGNYFKTWHWFYRFIMACRTIEGFYRRMWHMARIRLRDILSTPWPEGSNIPRVPDGNGGTRPAAIGEVYTSEKAAALILRWHIKSPSHIVNGGQVGQNLREAYNLADLSDNNPNSWNDNDEETLIDGIIDKVDQMYQEEEENQANNNNNYNKYEDLKNSMNDVANWPTWLNGNNPRGYTLDCNALDANNTGLRTARNSFLFDDSELPPPPSYT